MKGKKKKQTPLLRTGVHREDLATGRQEGLHKIHARIQVRFEQGRSMLTQQPMDHVMVLVVDVLLLLLLVLAPFVTDHLGTGPTRWGGRRPPRGEIPREVRGRRSRHPTRQVVTLPPPRILLPPRPGGEWVGGVVGVNRRMGGSASLGEG